MAVFFQLFVAVLSSRSPHASTDCSAKNERRDSLALLDWTASVVKIFRLLRDAFVHETEPISFRIGEDVPAP